MKKYFRFLRIISFVLVAAGFIYSCGDDDVESGGANSQNKRLAGTKWTTTNWDYGVGDDWAGIFDETYNIYFYSQTEGVFYYGRKDLDSDFGSSSSRSVAHFTYNVEGSVVKLDYINNPMHFSSTLNFAGNTISMNGISFNKGTIGSSDNSWLNTLQGTTGYCKWYYDLSGSLYVRGDGDMADYTSFSNTPWGKNNRIPNYVGIQAGVTSIGSFAFANPSIGEVYIDSDAKLRKIGVSAFSGTCISKISLPDEVTVIGESAFSDCEYLSKVYMPSKIEEIGNYAFSGCKSASLALTKNLRRVGSGAFGGCEIVSWTNSKVLEYIGAAAIGKIGTDELDLPSIKELGHLAFHDTKIKKINIGSNLRKVTGTPFAGVSSSGTVTIDVSSPLALEYNFIDDDCVKNWSLVVPSGSENKYKSAPYWKNFKSVNGGSGSGDEGNQEGGESDRIIVTGDAIPGIFGAKLFGYVNTGGKYKTVGFKISTSSDFPSGKTKYGSTSSTTGNYTICVDSVFSALEPNTRYFYQAYVDNLNGHSCIYGETKTFTTLKSKCPSNLTYELNGRSYKMILVSGGPTGDFYIMQTELPHSYDIYVAGEYIPRIDREPKDGDGHVVLREWRYFIDEIRFKTGIEWRLPTADEWKYAAKGGNQSKGTKYSGSNNLSDVAWYNKNSGT